MKKREVVNRKIHKGREEMYPDMENNGDGFGSKEIVGREERGVRIGAKGICLR